MLDKTEDIDMKDTELLQQALALPLPWKVMTCAFSATDRRLDISVDFPSGSRFQCPTCNETCPIHDTATKQYRHLDFFQHKTFLSARVPRVKCSEHGVLQVPVPWARPGSGFSLMFEGLVIFLAPHMAVKHLSRFFGEHDTRLWRMIHSQIEEARAKADYSAVHRMAFDETAGRRGHDYVTVAVDLDEKRVLFATPGKGSACIGSAALDLKRHGGDPKAIDTVACDMSPAFTAGIRKYLPNATITYDRFHVTQLIINAVQETRRDELRECAWKREILKGHHWALVTNAENQTEKQKKGVASIIVPSLHLKTGRAYQLKLAFQTAYECGVVSLGSWCSWAARSRIPAMASAARSIRKHWDGIVSWFKTDVTSAIMEGYNSLFQAAKSRARGYRNNTYFIEMMYLIAGKLDFTAKYPTHSI
jgi:transposase